MDSEVAVPPGAGNLVIEVKPDDDDRMPQTNILCRCGKQVNVWSDGPKTPQKIACLEHGLITQFPDQDAFREFVRVMANKILAAHGHDLIEPDAEAIEPDFKTPPESLN
jgi:hypothetical protein